MGIFTFERIVVFTDLKLRGFLSMGEKFYIFRFIVGTCLVLFAIFMFLIFICNILVYGIFNADLIGAISPLIFIGLTFIIAYFIYPHEKDSIPLGNQSDNDNYKNPSSQHANSQKAPTNTSQVKVKSIFKSNSQSNNIPINDIKTRKNIVFMDLYSKIINNPTIHYKSDAYIELNKIVGSPNRNDYFKKLLNEYNFSDFEGDNIIKSVRNKIDSDYLIKDEKYCPSQSNKIKRVNHNSSYDTQTKKKPVVKSNNKSKNNSTGDNNRNFDAAFDDLYGRIQNKNNVHTMYDALKQLDKLVGYNRDNVYFNDLLNKYELSHIDGDNLIESVKNKIDHDYPLTYKQPKNQPKKKPRVKSTSQSITKNDTQTKKKPVVKSTSQSNRVNFSSGSDTERALRNRKAENNPYFMHKTIRNYPKNLKKVNHNLETDAVRALRSRKAENNPNFRNVEIESSYQSTSQSNTKQITQRTRNVSLSTRTDVFERDNYTCQICRRNSKEDGVKLEIDHIIPVSKGGSDDISNLQTLCFDCNRGKSNKILHNQINR